MTVDPDVGMLRLLGDLLAMGVPAAAAADALRAIEEGATAREAAEIVLDATEPSLDAALQARAEATVLRAEIAVRDRVPVPVRREES